MRGSDNMSSRFNEKSEEEKEAIRKKISESQRKRLAKLTDKDKERISENHRQAMLNRSEEAKKKSIEKYRETMSKKDKKEITKSRQQQIKTCKETWKNKSQKEMKEWSKLHKDIYDSFDDKKLEDIANKKREAWKNILDNMTEEERQLFNESRSKGFKNYWNNLSEEEKENWKNRSKQEGIKGFKNYITQIGIDKHKDNCRKNYANISIERKIKIAQKISDHYNNLSNKEKQQFAEIRKASSWSNFSDSKRNLIINKIHITKKLNNSYGKSKLEDNIFNLLSKSVKVQRQYTYKNYAFDFMVQYDNKMNLIDIHGSFYHHNKPFSYTDEDLLEYDNLINKGGTWISVANTWRYRDVERFNICQFNNTNYIRIYIKGNKLELQDYIKIMSLIKDNLNKGQITLFYSK